MCDSDFEIDRPSPVPPKLRRVVPSACWNGSKMMPFLPSATPMPVSMTLNAIRSAAGVQMRGVEAQVGRDAPDRQRDGPRLA